jgi:hypothetical protein
VEWEWTGLGVGVEELSVHSQHRDAMQPGKVRAMKLNPANLRMPKMAESGG